MNDTYTVVRKGHRFDDDAVCIHCGFDGAEWWHWKRNTYEGRASELSEPDCKSEGLARGSFLNYPRCR